MELEMFNRTYIFNFPFRWLESKWGITNFVKSNHNDLNIRATIVPDLTMCAFNLFVYDYLISDKI